MQQELIFWGYLWIQLRLWDAHRNCQLKATPGLQLGLGKIISLSKSLRFMGHFWKNLPNPSLITRPKLNLNAEPLVAIYDGAGASSPLQIIEISQFLLKFLPLKFREQHCGFFKLSCCTNQTSLYEHGKSKDIRCAFLTTGEWLTIFWKYG